MLCRVSFEPLDRYPPRPPLLPVVIDVSVMVVMTVPSRLNVRVDPLISRRTVSGLANAREARAVRSVSVPATTLTRWENAPGEVLNPRHAA